jgi:Helix-turn-helix domain
VVAGDQHVRWGWERAVRESSLTAPARLVALVVATYTDPDGTTPVQHTPSFSALARATGLDRTTVARKLKELEDGGWLERHPPRKPDARSQKARNRYTITVPTGGTVPLPGLGTRGTVPPPPVVEDLTTSGTVPHNQNNQTQPDHARAELLADAILGALPDRLAGKVRRSQMVTECAKLPDSWTTDALERAVKAGPWGDARSGGLVVSWIRDQAHRNPRPPSTPRGYRCPRGAVVAADGSCCGLDHGDDIARSA